MNSEKKIKGFLEKYNNYIKAFANLENGMKDYNLDQDSEIMKAGLIKLYEICWELGWKSLKEYMEDEAIQFMPTPRQTIKQAYQLSLIEDEDNWMSILDDRNEMNHTYNQMKSDELLIKILNNYFFAFKELKLSLDKLSLKYEKE
jgi:nucleotidyltransferase substrate binding protein (TIGR01987 family)